VDFNRKGTRTKQKTKPTVDEEWEESINSHLAEPEEASDEVEMSSSEESEEENEEDKKPKANELGTPVKKGVSTPN